MQYRTEIHIADDRYVCLQLPDFIPPGRATVVVSVANPADRPAAREPDDDLRRDAEDPDFEWWDDIRGADPRRD